MNDLDKEKKVRDEIRKSSYSFVIRLAHSLLNEVPSKILNASDISCIRRLDLSNNNISLIPPQISNLVELRELWLQSNPIRQIPSSIQYCAKLEVLDLKSTEIVELPPEICNLKQLFELDFSLTPYASTVAQAYEVKDTNLSGLKKVFENMYQRKCLKADIIEKLMGELYIKESDDPKSLLIVNDLVEVCTHIHCIIIKQIFTLLYEILSTVLLLYYLYISLHPAC